MSAPEGLQDTTMGVRIEQWGHWEGRRVTSSLCHSSKADSTKVCCFDDIGYKQRLCEKLQRLWSLLCSDLQKDSG